MDKLEMIKLLIKILAAIFTAICGYLGVSSFLNN